MAFFFLTLKSQFLKKMIIFPLFCLLFGNICLRFAAWGERLIPQGTRPSFQPEPTLAFLLPVSYLSLCSIFLWIVYIVTCLLGLRIFHIHLQIFRGWNYHLGKIKVILRVQEQLFLGYKNSYSCDARTVILVVQEPLFLWCKNSYSCGVRTVILMM